MRLDGLLPFKNLGARMNTWVLLTIANINSNLGLETVFLSSKKHSFRSLFQLALAVRVKLRQHKFPELESSSLISSLARSLDTSSQNGLHLHCC